MRDGLMAEEEGSGEAPGGPVDRARPDLRAVAPPADRYADWREVYDDNVVRIHRLMYAKVGNRPDAEDLTAEVFLAALGPLRLSVSRGEVRAYLLRTAQTVLASFWRRRLGVEVTTIELSAAPPLPAGAPAPAPADDGGGGVATQRAHRILAALPDRYRRVLELRFVEG
ncbi:MAG TPA: RNA polymerase sigma factor, partial [Acidimicrobiia bacterium]|nr:RNA polymerase sigma factor [Acidimicrobiia bacterium]